MTTIKEIKSKLAEYTNPASLGAEILKALTKELYVSNAKEYNNLAHTFFMASLQNDRALSSTVICNWLECSEFKDTQALDYLNKRSGDIEFVCDAYCSSEIKYKVLMLWCSEPGYEIMHVSDLFSGIVKRTKNQTKKTLTSKFNLDDLHKLKLVTELVRTNKDCLRDKNLKVAINMNYILNSLDLCHIPTTEIAKVMVLYQHLNKLIIDKISRLYPKDRFQSILQTAHAVFNELNKSIH